MLDALTKAAQALGFSRLAAIPVAPASEAYSTYFADYLGAGYAADLDYLKRKERFDLQSIYKGAQTLLLFFYPYRFRNIEAKLRASQFKVARYAWQKDYHHLLKGKIQELLADFSLEGRAVTDSAPLFERYWARRAGLGRIGRNGMLIDHNNGSYFFIATALITSPLERAILPAEIKPESDIADICGECRLCVDACPTGALIGNGLMHTERCLSYQTIESKVTGENFPEPKKKHRWIFGCDICQQVCPYNKAESSYAGEQFNEEHPVAARVASGLEEVTNKQLINSVFARRGLKKLRQNISKLGLDAP